MADMAQTQEMTIRRKLQGMKNRLKEQNVYFTCKPGGNKTIAHNYS
jgi:hypothetical protein